MGFYGGKEGKSFILKERFSSLKEMVEAFAQGEEYTVVGYGEFCIIDTVDKHNPMNGCIYGRGLDSLELVHEYLTTDTSTLEQEDIDDLRLHPGAGAEYKGQIVGPQGPASEIVVDDYNAILNDPTVEHNTGTVGVKNGKEDPTIDFVTADIADEWGNIIGIRLGFMFPYTVTEFTAEQQPDYDLPDELAEKIDDGTNAFYNRFKLTIPKGKHGTDFESIQIDPVTQQYSYTTRQYNDNIDGNTETFDLPYYHRVIKDIEPIYIDDDKLQKLKVTYTTETDEYEDHVIFDVITLRGITVNQDGSVIMTYTNGLSTQIGVIQWVTNFRFNEESCQIEVEYNTEPDVWHELGTQIRFIEDVRYNEDNQSIEVKYNTNEDYVTVKNQLKFIDEVRYNDVTHRFEVKYNTNQDFVDMSDDIRILDGLRYIDSTGQIQVKYNLDDDYWDLNPDTPFVQVRGIKYNWDSFKYAFHYNTDEEDVYHDIGDKVTWITGAEIADDNRIWIHFNDASLDRPISGKINFITDIDFENTTVFDSQQIRVDYMTDADTSESIYIGDPINCIKELKIVDNYLYALYTDPVTRANLPRSEVVIFDDRLEWHKLGYVKGDIGNLNFYAEYDSLNDLYNEFPEGINDSKHDGWLVTVMVNGIKMIYGYNYNEDNPGWIELGSLDVSHVNAMTVIKSGQTQEEVTALQEHGIWYVLEE